MTPGAAEPLASTTTQLAPDPQAGRLAPLIVPGHGEPRHPRDPGPEPQWVIAVDLRSFRHPAERATAAPATAAPATAAFATSLAEGEAVAADHLTVFVTACDLTEEQIRAHAHAPAPAARSTPPTWPGWLSTAPRQA
ncbi:hypothetical protein [Streptomyces sp. NPDC007905]|uniref:hypothetical protein n=1 Tax=Streptomyces sp. NPDC007905 TaxID=3364788 RepID=UPI0036E0AA60